jgi:hypothetical protein
MMSHPNVSTERLQHVFTALQNVDDLTILSITKAFDYTDAECADIVKAFRALVSDLPAHSTVSQVPLRRVGIVGASSVPTALWPYLIVAYANGVPVKVKVRADDVRSLSMLAEILRYAFRMYTGRQLVADDMPWDVTVEAGDVLLDAGFWDDCDRLLVFGSDATVDIYRQRFPTPGRVIGFGHVESLLLVDMVNVSTDLRWITDFLAFGHIGCLAPRLVVPADDCVHSELVDAMLRKLTGLVIPDIERAVALRQEHHARTVQSLPSWLSADGMWLITSDDSVAPTYIPGHLQIVSPSVVSASKCSIGTFSAPATRVYEAPELLQLQKRATWDCQWGMAQFPSMHWCNAGVPIVAALCSQVTRED